MNFKTIQVEVAETRPRPGPMRTIGPLSRSIIGSAQVDPSEECYAQNAGNVNSISIVYEVVSLFLPVKPDQSNPDEACDKIRTRSEILQIICLP